MLGIIRIATARPAVHDHDARRRRGEVPAVQDHRGGHQAQVGGELRPHADRGGRAHDAAQEAGLPRRGGRRRAPGGHRHQLWTCSDFFLDITGCWVEGATRITVKLQDRAGQLAALLASVNAQGGYIVRWCRRAHAAVRGVCAPRPSASRPRDAGAVVQGLREAGYEPSVDQTARCEGRGVRPGVKTFGPARLVTSGRSVSSVEGGRARLEILRSGFPSSLRRHLRPTPADARWSSQRAHRLLALMSMPHFCPQPCSRADLVPFQPWAGAEAGEPARAG